MSVLPGVAKEDMVGFAPPPKPPKPEDPPNVLPPNVGLVEPPNAPNPLPELSAGDLLPAKEESLPVLAAPKGELEAVLVLEKPPNGDAAELAKPPKPDDLNLSSDV